ncbi:MAG: hypothetical protein K8I27_09775 [Planctomycetes bacterium]|nr:hypothetical protein [Planctomycetota bacterium]
MTRLLPALLVVAISAVLVGAQPEQPKPPIEATQNESGEWVWTLASEGEVPVTDLLSMYASCRESLVVYDPRKIVGITSFTGPESTELTGDAIDMFVANSLGDFRLCLTRSGEGQFRIIPAAEAVTNAPVVEIVNLESTPDWQWITVVMKPENAEVNALRGALQNLTTRQGGVVNPVAGSNALLVCDRADRVKDLYALALKLDEENKAEIRKYEVPAGIEPANAIKALKELLDAPRRPGMNVPTYTQAIGEDIVIVRATPKFHEDVAAAFAAMK